MVAVTRGLQSRRYVSSTRGIHWMDNSAFCRKSRKLSARANVLYPDPSFFIRRSIVFHP